jgi:hypothetical protein
MGSSPDVLVVGAGHFGRLALERLGPRVLAIADLKPDSDLQGPDRQVWALDGAEAVERALGLSKPPAWILPAVPVHLATQWLRMRLGAAHFRPMELSERDLPEVAWKMSGGPGLWYLSLADFRCPPDCPEPASTCTVTGQPRGVPMFERLAKGPWPGKKCSVIRSWQMAPGLGAVKTQDLLGLADQVGSSGAGEWIVATSCRCHAVLEAFFFEL